MRASKRVPATCARLPGQGVPGGRCELSSIRTRRPDGMPAERDGEEENVTGRLTHALRPDFCSGRAGHEKAGGGTGTSHEPCRRGRLASGYRGTAGSGRGDARAAEHASTALRLMEGMPHEGSFFRLAGTASRRGHGSASPCSGRSTRRVRATRHIPSTSRTPAEISRIRYCGTWPAANGSTYSRPTGPT